MAHILVIFLESIAMMNVRKLFVFALFVDNFGIGIYGIGKQKKRKALTNYNKMEKNQAKRDHLTPVKNSGRGFKKGDAGNDNILCDYKFCSGKSFSLNLEKFVKHEKDAWRENKMAVVVAVFEKKQIAMVDWDFFKELLGEGYAITD